VRRKLDKVVLIKGAGEVATGVAVRLFRCNFRVVVLELPEPRALRRQVAFAEAVYAGKAVVEGISCYQCATAHEARTMAERGGSIPLLVDPEAQTVPAFGPVALVDARMNGVCEGTSLEDAPLVIGLGPGFVCGEDVHLVIETAEGPRMGRVLYEGSAVPDPEVESAPSPTTDPADVFAPASGEIVHAKRIGDSIEPNEVLLSISGAEARSRVGGLVSGLIHEGIRVEEGWRVARIDPGGRSARLNEIGSRPLAIAGGVLEAIISAISIRVRI
jgi:xanthine dehydrogenase accessory factor